MKRVALAAIAALALAGIWATTATSESTTARHITPQTHSPPHNLTPPRCTIEGFRPFSKAVWRLGAWERGNPPVRVLEARTASLACAAPHHRAAMKRTWRRDAERYFAHRDTMKLRAKIEPFYGCTVAGCGWWAIPAWSANCESGGGAVASNIYGNLANYRGGSKWEQSVTAYELMLENGGQNASTYEQVWLAWEGGCSGYPGEGWSPDR